MATVTDLYGNEITELDLTSVGISQDSNINVFEFGNLILADILPSLLFLVNFVSDDYGGSISVSDLVGASISEGDSVGVVVLEEDSSGTSASQTDLSGSSLVVTDSSLSLSEDSNINAYEFGNLILADLFPSLLWTTGYLLDLSGSSLNILDCSGSLSSETDIAGATIISYDSSDTYDSATVTYDGVVAIGAVVDISGS